MCLSTLSSSEQTHFAAAPRYWAVTALLTLRVCACVCVSPCVCSISKRASPRLAARLSISPWQLQQAHLTQALRLTRSRMARAHPRALWCLCIPMAVPARGPLRRLCSEASSSAPRMTAGQLLSVFVACLLTGVLALIGAHSLRLWFCHLLRMYHRVFRRRALVPRTSVCV